MDRFGLVSSHSGPFWAVLGGSSLLGTPGGTPVLGFRVYTFDTQRLDRLYGVRPASCLAMAFSSPSLTWAARSGALRSLAERSDSFGLSRGGSEPSARL